MLRKDYNETDNEEYSIMLYCLNCGEEDIEVYIDEGKVITKEMVEAVECDNCKCKKTLVKQHTRQLINSNSGDGFGTGLIIGGLLF